ncbi:hypothetical protein D3C85_1831700 [compost metagenome]
MGQLTKSRFVVPMDVQAVLLRTGNVEVVIVEVTQGVITFPLRRVQDHLAFVVQ